MRRSTKIVALAAVATLALAGCAKDDKKSDNNAGSGPQLDCEGGGDGPKVGIAYDIGGAGDDSFNDSSIVGMAKAVKDLGATCVTGEATTGEPEATRESRLRDMADAGSTAIIGVGFAYSDSANAVAPDYPEVSFAVVDGYDPDTAANDNVAYLGFAENEGSFLMGVAAAMKSEAKHVGFLGGVHVDLIKKFEAGFVAGVEAVDPSITVDVKYLQESDIKGFNDPAAAKVAATGMYEAGADIIFHATGASGSGLFDAAVDAGDGKWVIGVDSDQYLSATPEQQAHILTSMLKRVDTATYDFIKSVADGDPLVSYQTYDLAVDGIGYSTSGGFIDDITGDLDDNVQKIKDGDITVPTTP